MRTNNALLSALMVVAMVAAATPAAAGEAASPASTYQESFEAGFGGWQPDTDGNARDWEITRVRGGDPSGGAAGRCFDGDWCLAYFLDGSFDDGTIWVERTFEVPTEGDLLVDMSFWLHNHVQSGFGGWLVVGFIGVEDPSSEFDFTIVGTTQETIGWQRYHHAVELDASQTDGEIWVGFGISANWETGRTHLVDLVEVEVTLT